MNNGQPLGSLFVIAAPSGAGKTTLVKALVKARPDIRFSISHTTRLPRTSERKGIDYFFIKKQEFEEMVEAGAFLEHALVFGNYYGTSRAAAESQLNQGHDVLLEIDWQGAQQVKQAMPECRTVFILPPSQAELERRLRGRKTDDDAEIARRLKQSVADMARWDEFDYVVVNDDFDQALEDLMAIVMGQGELFRSTEQNLQGLLQDLLA
ncbi:MAG: guanylate kinase [Pseudomonadota bacterium]